jgi:hypothetical protein
MTDAEFRGCGAVTAPRAYFPDFPRFSVYSR